MAHEPDQVVDEVRGSLLVELSNTMVQEKKQFYGKGPLSAKSYLHDDLVFVVMRGGITTAERSLLDHGRQDQVREFRQAFENEMAGRLTGKVEEILGRRVLNYQSQIMFDPDVVVEMFVLEEAAGA